MRSILLMIHFHHRWWSKQGCLWARGLALWQSTYLASKSSISRTTQKKVRVIITPGRWEKEKTNGFCGFWAKGKRSCWIGTKDKPALLCENVTLFLKLHSMFYNFKKGLSQSLYMQGVSCYINQRIQSLFGVTMCLITNPAQHCEKHFLSHLILTKTFWWELLLPLLIRPNQIKGCTHSNAGKCLPDTALWQAPWWRWMLSWSVLAESSWTSYLVSYSPLSLKTWQPEKHLSRLGLAGSR